jgi:myo-inositol catabolism protein IolC
MSIGYSSPLYALPCDERERLVEALFGCSEPRNATELAAVAALEGVLYAGFRQASEDTTTQRQALFVANERYGSAPLAHAIDRGYLTALGLERSGGGELQFEQCDFTATLDRWQTMFGKVRLGFDANDDPDLNARVLERLRRLLVALRSRDRLMMIELTTPPAAILSALEALQEGGADPDVWILPPLGRRDAELAGALVRRDGRDEVSCLVRGHGGDPARMRDELASAATVRAYVGFSTEPDAFADIARASRSGSASFADLAERVAERYGAWIECFRAARVTFSSTADGGIPWR